MMVIWTHLWTGLINSLKLIRHLLSSPTSIWLESFTIHKIIIYQINFWNITRKCMQLNIHCINYQDFIINSFYLHLFLINCSIPGAHTFLLFIHLFIYINIYIRKTNLMKFRDYLIQITNCCHQCWIKNPENEHSVIFYSLIHPHVPNLNEFLSSV